MDSESSSSCASPCAAKTEIIINVSEEKRSGALPKHNGDEIDVECMKEIVRACIDSYRDTLCMTISTKTEIMCVLSLLALPARELVLTRLHSLQRLVQFRPRL